MKPIQIGICADSGYSNSFQQSNGQCLRSLPLDYCFLLGDNFYPIGLSNPTDPLFQTHFKQVFPDITCFSILGNHDYLGNPNAQLEICQKSIDSRWKMPYFFYDLVLNVQQESVHFIFIDTCLLLREYTLKLLSNDSNKSNFQRIYQENYKCQLVWLKQILSESRSKWKIVCGHYPIYSNGPHQTSTSLQAILLPLFREYKVDCYLSGHDHNLQHIFKHNIHFLISGSFSDIYRPVQPPSDVMDTEKIFMAEIHGFLVMEIQNDSILQFHFTDFRGNRLHSFQLEKK